MNIGENKKKLKGLSEMATKQADVPASKSAASDKLPSMKTASEPFTAGLKKQAAKAKLKSKIAPKKKEDYNATSEGGVNFTYDKEKYATPAQQAEELDIKSKMKKLKLQRFYRSKNGK